jgi:hypothetical protein
MRSAGPSPSGNAASSKSTELRLAEVMDIYAKLREVRVFDDPGLLRLKADCQTFVRDGTPARGTCRVGALARDLQYDLRTRSGQPTVAVIKAPVGEEDER